MTRVAPNTSFSPAEQGALADLAPIRPTPLPIEILAAGGPKALARSIPSNHSPGEARETLAGVGEVDAHGVALRAAGYEFTRPSGSEHLTSKALREWLRKGTR